MVAEWISADFWTSQQSARRTLHHGGGPALHHIMSQLLSLSTEDLNKSVADMDAAVYEALADDGGGSSNVRTMMHVPRHVYNEIKISPSTLVREKLTASTAAQEDNLPPLGGSSDASGEEARQLTSRQARAAWFYVSQATTREPSHAKVCSRGFLGTCCLTCARNAMSRLVGSVCLLL